jgi:hypothetical protein
MIFGKFDERGSGTHQLPTTPPKADQHRAPVKTAPIVAEPGTAES